MLKLARIKVVVLGTGVVGRSHAARLAELGHEVFIGTKDVTQTLEDQPDQMGNPPFSIWHKENSKVKLETFSDAAKEGEIIWNALNGSVSLEVPKSIELNLEGKILNDISNPLDFSSR
jgi:8-hydroxy-5-deazaflavin:NADPH oxidoreductase